MCGLVGDLNAPICHILYYIIAPVRAKRGNLSPNTEQIRGQSIHHDTIPYRYTAGDWGPTAARDANQQWGCSSLPPKLSHFHFSVSASPRNVVDIDDFVDNFDFIMLIKCYGLKCSTVAVLPVTVASLVVASCWCHMGSAYVFCLCLITH